MVSFRGQIAHLVDPFQKLQHQPEHPAHPVVAAVAYPLPSPAAWAPARSPHLPRQDAWIFLRKFRDCRALLTQCELRPAHVQREARGSGKACMRAVDRGACKGGGGEI